LNDREQKLVWLSRGRNLRTKLIGLYAERQERVSRAEYAGIAYDRISGQSSGNGTEAKLLSVQEINEEIRNTEQELSVIESQIREAIAQVHRPLYQTYLRMRFLGYKTESQIAQETKYSLEHIRGYVRKNAVDSIKINPF
jgi:hypothetical protein